MALAWYFQSIEHYWFVAMVLLSVILLALAFVCKVLKLSDLKLWWAYRSKV